MAQFLYSTAFYLLIPFICLRLWWRGRLVPAYRLRWRERFGFVASIPADKKVIWIHAVSVGESIAALPLIRQLQQQFSDHILVVTTTTPTGSERVVAMLADSVQHCYAPYDLPDAVARFLRRIHPQIAIVMETELWPTIIHACQRRQIPVVLANGRLSAKSALGYQRFKALSAPMMAKLTRVAAQHEDDARRFSTLGVVENQLQVTGNIKFDIELSAHLRQKAQALGREWRGPLQRPVWLAASTHQGEDELILQAFQQLLATHPNLLLVLVPRHPDRFDQVAALCDRAGFRQVRRSRQQIPCAETQILLGDTMGELALFFGSCDVTFVGGSLVPVGGHNLMEPAAWQLPILSGPHLHNFYESSQLLKASGGLVVCNDVSTIVGEVTVLLKDPAERRRRGEAAFGVVANNRGALGRLMALIAPLLATLAVPDQPKH